MSTPAEAKGIVSGKTYTIARMSGWTHCMLLGDVIKLRRDDGSEEPKFERISDGVKDYISIHDVDPVDVPEPPSSISVRVEKGVTMFIVGRVLTLAERAAVFNLLSSQGA